MKGSRRASGTGEADSAATFVKRRWWRGAFCEKRPRWGLTWRGWFAGLGLALVGTLVFFHTAHSFLALDQPVGASLLVVEGWIPEYAVAQHVPVIQSGRYTHVITVGGPVAGVASPAPTDDTRAYVAAKVLKRNGVDPKLIHIVPTHTVSRDRTFQTATELRRWLEANALRPARVDILTLGAHARRTRLLFGLALGADVSVGVIAVPNEEYEASHWWRYSEGVKEVISEGAGYLYAKFLFYPGSNRP